MRNIYLIAGLGVGAILLFGSEARADFEVVADNNTAASGDLVSDTDSETFRVTLSAGSQLALSLKGAKEKGQPKPGVGLVVLDDAGVEVGTVTTKPGRAKMRKTTIAASGDYRIVVSSDRAGEYQLKAKWKAPRGMKMDVDLSGGPQNVSFAAEAGSVARIQVKALKGSGALPRLDRIESADGVFAEPLDAPDSPDARSHKIKDLLIPVGGDMVLHVADAGTGGTAAVRVKLRAPKAPKRKLDVHDQALGIPPGAAGTMFVRVLDESGGDLSVDGPSAGALRGAGIHVPGGALSESIPIVIGAGADIPQQEQDFVALGPPLALEPSGLQFSSPATGSLPFDPTGFDGDFSDVRVYVSDASGAVTLAPPASYVFEERGTPPTQIVSFDLGHFSGAQAHGRLPGPLLPGTQASDGAVGDLFGWSLAISGNRMVVGAPGADAAYVFERSGGRWSETKKLLPTSPDGQFGHSVAIDGDTIVVGAPDFLQTGSGPSAHVFVFDATQSDWCRQRVLVPSDLTGSTLRTSIFGMSVGVSGDTVVAGAPFENGPPFFDPGSVYVFTRSSNDCVTATWNEVKLGRLDAALDDAFGWAVAIEGGTIVIGKPGSREFAVTPAAYVFTLQNSTWTEQQRITPPAATYPNPRHGFGAAVALSGNTLVVGWPAIDGTFSLPGLAFVFTQSGGIWSQQADFSGSGADRFGGAVAIADNEAVFGAPVWAHQIFIPPDGPSFHLNGWGDVPTGAAGEAWTATRSGSTWTTLTATNTFSLAADARYGAALALDAGGSLVIGAPGMRSASSPQPTRGAIFVVR